jgi:hypothetical protein
MPPSSASASTARRAGYRRCCSSTGGSKASGRTSGSGGRLDVTVEPFGRIATDVREAAGAEAERLATFLGGKLSWKWA